MAAQSQNRLEKEIGPGVSSGWFDRFRGHGLDPRVEVVAVILLIVVRPVANSLAGLHWLGVPPIRPFGYFQFSECLRGLYLSGFVLFVVALKNESWAEVGLSIPHWIKDLIIAFAIVIVTMLIWIPVAVLSENLGSFVFHKPHIRFIYSSTIGEMFWICVTALIVGFGEELLIRGYLLSRLLRIIGPVMSVIASSVVFAAWHIPTGVGAVVHTFIWGVVYGWTFVKIRRLYPLALAHAINNAIAYLWI